MILPKHYVKSALTNFRRNRWYTSLMVFSLAAGMFCFVLAQLYVNYEFSRNDNHEYAERIYQIKLRLGENGRNINPPLKYVEQLKSLFPNIEAVSMLDRGKNEYITADNASFVKEETPFYANSDFFEVFTFPLKYGNKKEALKNEKNVVISERLADVLFPGIDPVGLDIMINEKGTFQIGGVLKSVSNLSVMNPSVLFTRAQRHKERPPSISTTVLLTHIKLKNNQPQDQLEESLYAAFKDIVVDDRISGIYTENLLDEYWGGTHFNYGTDYYSTLGMDKVMINAMSYIGIAVLLCAFVGYLSLYLSISVQRSKEIGIRKVNGAVRSDIRIQILSESVFYAFLALVITIVSLELSSSYFSNIFQVPIAFDMLKPYSLIWLLIFTFITGFSAGLYPAFVVAKMNPITILSDFNSQLGKGFNLKRSLLVLQLVISGILVFSVLTLQMHIKEMNRFDIGYQTKDLIAFEVEAKNIRKNFSEVKSAISQTPGVFQVSGGPFPYNMNGYEDVTYAKGDTVMSQSAALAYVAGNFFELMNIELKSGLGFEQLPYASFEQVCIVNEAFTDAFGTDVLGESVRIDGKLNQIIGVSKDYSMWGLSNPIAIPQIFVPVTEPKYNSLIVKVDPIQRKDVLSALEDIWRTHEIILQPEITFLDELESESLNDQSKIKSLISFLASIVLILSLMNLFGISLMYARSKLKNISIRRILGAETFELFIRLVLPFVYTLLLSLAISIPISYWLMERYLSDFAVRVELDFIQGLVLVVIMLVVLLAVTGIQMIRTSKVDPVLILKDE